jgi:nitrogen fixation/metabolism regulation signal transduction histidine kinase
MIEKHNEQLRVESQHREEKLYQLEQQIRQSENSFSRSQQELNEYRQVAESAIEELQKLRQMLESQSEQLAVYQERDLEPKHTKMVSEIACQTLEQIKSPKATKCDASTSDSVSTSVLEANRKKYQVALKERNDFAIFVNNQLDKKLKVNAKLSGSFSFDSVSKVVYKKLNKLLTVHEIDEQLEKEKRCLFHNIAYGTLD